MKRKILIVLVIISLFMVTGCVKKGIFKSNTKAEGRMYNYLTLQDKGINMFNTLVPEGWTATISSENMVNSSYPFVETVEITNPDKTAKISILSQHSFTENAKFNEGVNNDYYTTYLHFMNAPTYMDYFMDKVYSGSTFVKDGVVEEQVKKDVNTLQTLKVDLANKDAQTLGGDQYGVHISVGDEGATITKREYQNGDKYYEGDVCVFAISTNIKSDLSSLLDSRAVAWYMPYLIVYEGNTKDDFDKYYDDYNFIVSNSSFTVDYYAMIEYVSSAIVNSVTSYYAAKSKAALDATNAYIDSNYSSDTSSDTMDKVREMWSDVIKEQDKYTLDDGTSIKVSTSTESVAQNGNEIYIGDKAGIPVGFDEVAKGY